MGSGEGATRRLTGNHSGLQTGTARNGETIFQGRRVRCKIQGGNTGSRGWRQIVRVDHFQHMLGEHGVVAVQLLLHPRSEKCEAVEQPFDVRVGTGVGIQAKPVGDAGMFAGKLAAQVADKAKFLFVVSQESLILDHAARPASATSA